MLESGEYYTAWVLPALLVGSGLKRVPLQVPRLQTPSPGFIGREWIETLSNACFTAR